jgi:aryl-alcohol dehydrogenase-like predicted oxidoreductase
MLYSRLGNTGLVVSRLALGTMTFTEGGGNVAIAKTGQTDADKMVGRALDEGINFFDTADIYAGGESERMLGRAIGARRDEVVIATKAGWRTGAPLTRNGLSAAHLHWSIDQSLERLGTDHVDVYIAHRNDVHTPLEETLVALDAIVRSGKARYLGVSNWPAWKVAAAIELQRANGWAPFSHIQMYYSLLGRGIEGEIASMLANYGLSLTAWSPLAGGFLSGKYTRESLTHAENRLSGFDMLPFDKEKGFSLVETMREIGTTHGASVAQVALAWVLSRPHVASVLVGASKLSQLDDNVAATGLILTPADLQRLDVATKPDFDFSFNVTNVHDAPVVSALAAKPGDKPQLEAKPVV